MNRLHPFLAVPVLTILLTSLTSACGGDSTAGPQASPYRLSFDEVDPDGEDTEIFTMRTDGSDLVQLTHDEVSQSEARWSPDGSMVSYVAHVDGLPRLGVMTADGTDSHLLTAGDAFEGSARWSPDGSSLVFHRAIDGAFEVYAIDSDGTNERQLTVDEPNVDDWDRWPSYSPDGNTIAFNSTRAGGEEIFLMDADGSNQRQLTFNDEWDGVPEWSSDGAHLAFGRVSEEIDRIIRTNADGTEPTHLTLSNGLDGDRLAVWSPDGRTMAFTSGRAGFTELFLLDVASGVISQATDLDSVVWGPVWSPDGRHLAFTIDRYGEIYVLPVDSDFATATGQVGEHLQWVPSTAP